MAGVLAHVFGVGVPSDLHVEQSQSGYATVSLILDTVGVHELATHHLVSSAYAYDRNPADIVPDVLRQSTDVHPMEVISGVLGAGDDYRIGSFQFIR